jgi:hypothetical protein
MNFEDNVKHDFWMSSKYTKFSLKTFWREAKSSVQNFKNNVKVWIVKIYWKRLKPAYVPSDEKPFDLKFKVIRKY